jgi:acetylornithine deacetylase/succinyl-diaminopimelate desuccinylase-like protein
MTDWQARIADLVDENFAAQTAFLRELVRLPTDTPPGDNAPHAQHTAELLEAMGYRAERHAVPAAEVKAAGLTSLTNLIVRRRFGAGPVMALSAHGDVVPPGDGWTKPPYAGLIEDGRMFGRGVAVSKSDFATYAFALRALEAVGAPLQGTVELHFTYDEEYGGLLGPGYLLRHGLSKPDMAIAAGFSYAVVTAHNGCLQLEASLRGRAAHAAMPESGSDALAAAVDVLNALYAERRSYASIRSSFEGIATPSLNVGVIAGGINTNVVPDQVTLRLDRRIIPEEKSEEVEARLAQVMRQAVEGKPGISLDIRRLLLAAALRPNLAQARLAETVQRHASAVFAEPIGLTASPLYTDARLYGEAGLPVVLYGAGPRTLLQANAKRADENILLADLRRATIVIARVLLDLLGADTGRAMQA